MSPQRGITQTRAGCCCVQKWVTNGQSLGQGQRGRMGKDSYSKFPRGKGFFYGLSLVFLN